jgi:DNA-directed RNA polymerase specialized sigma24 family protein
MSASAGQSIGSLPTRMVPLDKRLAMTEQISQAVRVLASTGNRFRRAEARALYAEGLTMAQVAAVLGVSRQRVSALLHQGSDGESPKGWPGPGPAITG